MTCAVKVVVDVQCCEGWQDSHTLAFKKGASRHYGQMCAVCGQKFIVLLSHSLGKTALLTQQCAEGE